MKNLPWLIALLSIIINIGLIYLFFFKGSTQPTNDNRLSIPMSKDHKNFVMAEMRGFLESVKLINEGILMDDRSKIIKAGEQSGNSLVDHTPQGLVRKLPLAFKELGFSTHDLFDEIAERAKTSFNKKETQIQLDILLNKCTACHASFKIDIEK